MDDDDEERGIWLVGIGGGLLSLFLWAEAAQPPSEEKLVLCFNLKSFDISWNCDPEGQAPPTQNRVLENTPL